MSTTVPGHAHVAHVSCQEALAVLGDLGVSAEVAPHHLFLDLRREDLRAYGKVNPPLRTHGDRAALWGALLQGRIPIIASDHAPHTRAEKDRRFEDAPPGIPGVETMVPLLMAEARSGRLGLQRLVDATAVRPAAFLGLARRGIETGLEAHIAVYDTREVGEVVTERLHHKCGWTPYEGMPAIFPSLVVSAGEVLVEDGVFQRSQPSGRYVGRDLGDLSASD
jgi:dihydroorotase